MTLQSLDRHSAELQMSAECPLNCSYCYVAKNDAISDIDKKIAEEFDEKGIFTMLKEGYDKELRGVSLWGSEPTLHLEYLTDDIPQILDYFPALSRISMSSNFYNKSAVDKILALTRSLMDSLDGREFTLDIQTSIDGPPGITNETRSSRDGGDTTEHITENWEYMLQSFTDLDLPTNFYVKNHFKPTVPMSNIRQLVKDEDKLFGYFDFFNNLSAQYTEREDKLGENFNLFIESGQPTMISPGEYTVDDGKMWADYIKEIKKLIIRDEKENLFERYDMYRALPSMSELERLFDSSLPEREQNQSFACGASSHGYALGVENSGHICHRTYLMGDDTYVDGQVAGMDRYEEGRYRRFRQNMIVDDHSDQRDFLRQQYVIKGYRDFSQFRFSYNYATVKFLASIDQANSLYLEEDELARLAAKFTLRNPVCVVENKQQTGSFHLSNLQGFKLWLNGALESLIRARNELVERGVI